MVPPVKVTREELYTKLSGLKDEVIRESKRVLKTKQPKSEVVRNQVRDNLLTLYNNFIFTATACYKDLDDKTYNEILKPFFNIIRDRVVRSYQVLQVDYKIPDSFLCPIDRKIKDELIDLTDDGDEEEGEGTETKRYKKEDLTMPMTNVEFFNLASRIIPNEFDGSVDKLTSFLDALNLLRANVDTHEDNAVAYVKTRLTGRARDYVGNAATLEEIRNRLQSTIRTDSSECISAKLLKHKQKHKDEKYIAEIEELCQKLKQAYIKEGVPEGVAETYTKNTAVKALISNAQSEKARIIMEAGSFTTIQSALSKFSTITEESPDHNTVLYASRRPYRGRTRSNFRGRWNYNTSDRNFAADARPTNGPNYRSNTYNNRGNVHRGSYNRNQNQQNQYYRPNQFIRACEGTNSIHDEYTEQENQQEPQSGPLGNS